jgi:hypothetical protein
MAEHIKTIQERNYVQKVDIYLVPTNLGIGLVNGAGVRRCVCAGVWVCVTDDLVSRLRCNELRLLACQARVAQGAGGRPQKVCCVSVLCICLSAFLAFLLPLSPSLTHPLSCAFLALRRIVSGAKTLDGEAAVAGNACFCFCELTCFSAYLRGNPVDGREVQGGLSGCAPRDWPA